MGGNALNIETKRLSREEYFKIVEEVYPKLMELINVKTPKFDVYDEMNCVPFYIIPAYKTKESFGDMDIILNKAHYDLTDMKSFLVKLKELFNYTDIYINKPVVSIDYKGFQIDLIFMKQKYMKSSLFYYSYNDLGNFMGRIAVRLGVRYGHFGLKYKVETEERDKLLGEFVLTSEPRHSFEFLGFDFDRFLEGFETLEDVFDYVISSKYFNKEIFAYENLDHQNRTRNRKRDSYRKFLEYIEPKTFEEKNIPSKEERMEMIFNTFPEVELEKKILELKEKEKVQKQIKEKFNGNLLMELFPELSGKSLGQFIGNFKSTFESDEDFNKFVLNNIQEKINNTLEMYYETFKLNN